MRSDRLNSILGKIHGPETTEIADLRCKRALEADLLSRYRKLYPKNRRWLMLLNPWNRITRFVLTGLALCGIVVGACTTDTITDVEMGKQLKMNLAKPLNMEAGDTALNQAINGKFTFRYEDSSPYDMIGESKNITDLLLSQPGVEDASVSINRQSTGDVSLNVLVWGAHLNADELVITLKEEYPVLADAHLTTEDLHASVKETYAAKIVREVFRIEVSGSDPEELRRQIIEQLAAQGVEDAARVHVDTDGDQKTVGIEIEGD